MRLEGAETLVRAKRMRDAAAAYRDEIERLTGPQRKQDIAQTYLGLADRALAGDKPDPTRAVTFYDLAVDLGLAPEHARSVRLLAAKAALLAGDANGAVQRLEALVRELQGHADQRRARLLLGDALQMSGQSARARAAFRDLIASAPDSAEAADASFKIAETFGVPEPGVARLDLAIAALRAFAKDHPSHPKAAVSEFLIARSYLSAGRSEDALTALREYLKVHGDESIDEVANARALVGDVLASQGKLDEAMDAWKAYLSAHAAHAQWERVQRAIVDAEFRRAELAAEDERFDAARKLYADFGRDHPLDPRNADVLRRIAETFAAEKKWELARDGFDRCVQKYPGREESSFAQFRIGEIWESQVFDYQKALDAYRAVTWGSFAAAAQARIRRLEEKSLGLKTLRTFHSGEEASFQLTSRNLPEVRVRVYRLDLETWFRATHLPGSVEKLDIEVIAPDKTFASKVTEYVPYRETQRDVVIGFGQPGAYVVKVDDSEREATTMVLVTDIALIVKSSRDELLAFTQNLKEDRVESGVRVVVSDGARILTEGVTDAKGFYRWKGKELANAAELRVFAVDAAGSGAGTLDLSALSTGEGLAERAWLCTDRPAYLPGEMVHVKAIAREVKDGLYVLPTLRKDETFRFVSPSGRVVQEGKVEFTPFGTLAMDLALPAESELGTWRAQLDRGEGRGASIEFEVARFELPRLLLDVEPTERIVFRGEKIAGRASVKHFYGEPARGRHLLIAMTRPDGSREQVEGDTDAEGKVEFSFDSQEFTEEAVARIDATLAEDGVAATTLIPVVTTEFEPSVHTLRDVFLAGSNFDVDVAIKDRSGAPLAKTGEVVLLRREAGKRGVTEVEVARVPFRTDGKSGEGRVQLSSKKGGDHVIRVQATDRFGQLVSAESNVTISGDDDDQKLRILLDRQSWHVGETAKARVVNRAGAHLALRTLQADGILECEAVRVPAGESTLDLVLEGRHAPNFALALAMIDGTQLRTAESEFFVARDLRVELKPAAETALPGSEVELEVVTTDAQGRPVAGEVAVAMVQSSLLKLFGDRTPDLSATFWGMRRQTLFRTESSCGWSYTANTRATSQDLVAEERRLAEEYGRNVAADPGHGETAAFFFNDGAEGGDLRARTENTFGAMLQRGHPAREAKPGEPAQQLDDLSRLSLKSESAFDSNQWNSAVGLGGGSGRRYAGRQQQVAGFDVFSVGSGGLVPGAIALPRVASAPRVDFSPAGGWLSSVVTDDNGHARVKLRMPDESTGYALVGRGVTRESDVGQGTASLRTARPVVAELTAPPFLVGGDRSTIRAHLHNREGDARTLAVKTEVAGKSDERKLELGVGAEAGFELPLETGTATELRARLSIDGMPGIDSEAIVPVLPFGVELRDGRAGVANDAAHLVLALPKDRQIGDLAMQIELVLGADRGLAAAALGGEVCALNSRLTLPTNLAIASRAMAALVALDRMEGDAQRAVRSALEALADGAIRSLVSAQSDDGSFAWVARGQADLRTTATALRALLRARAHGNATAQPAIDRATRWLTAALRGARDEDRIEPERALVEAGQDRFEALNALHRRRASLDLTALGRLALAWRAAHRPELAAEVDEVSRQKLGGSAAGEKQGIGDPSHLLAIALVAESLLRGSAADPVALQLVARIEASRIGAGWSTPEVTAAAIEALAQSGVAARRGASTAAEIEVVVNGTKLPLEKGDVASIRVPADKLKAGDNSVDLTLRGSGPLRYSVQLSGFSRDFVPADMHRDLVRVGRVYRPDFLRDSGRAVNPGFSVVSGRYDAFDNKLTELAVGGVARVETFVMAVTDNEGHSSMLPLVVEEPIPAGCTVPRDSVQGSFEKFEVLPDRIVAWYREGVSGDSLRYQLVGRFPGKYRALPTLVYGATRPDLRAFGPVGEIVVLPRGAAGSDAYRMTPDELWQLGKSAFERKDYEAAWKKLSELSDTWTLRGDVHRDLARMMLFIAIARADTQATVRWFEVVKDRYPELVLTFEDMRAVGRAYIEIGEFESAVLVFRGTTEASFLKDAAVSNTLEKLGEVQASVRFLRGLLDTYPGLNTMRQSLYGIGQQLGLLAGNMKPGDRVNDKVGSRALLQRQAVETLREFLIEYPDDPLAEEVSFAWATTLIEAGQLEPALDVATGALARYTGSTMEDEFLYTAGYARFVLGKPDEALAAVRRVAEEEFPRRDGGRGPSENRKHAIYLEGQIRHALGQAADALASYDKVTDDFQDAAEASAYFRQKSLSVAEVTRFAMGADARLELRWRNLKSADVKVYKVDLMRLYLQQKSLDNVRGVLLHGIQPLHQATLTLGDGKDCLGERKSDVDLPLPDAGAYLVVVRADDMLASGLVLRSDLEIDAQESFDVGRVRVNVKRKGAFVPGAHVKVVGSGDGQVRAGDSDPRGIYVADGLVGRATVIAQVDDAYAFFRGQAVHQPAQFRPAPEPQADSPSQQPGAPRGKGRAFDAWENNVRFNNDNRARQVQWLEQQVKTKNQQGVEVYRAK